MRRIVHFGYEVPVSGPSSVHFGYEVSDWGRRIVHFGYEVHAPAAALGLG